MDKEKFLKSEPKYLDLAKNVTTLLHDVCIESKEEYNIPTVLAGVSIGFYMFIRELAQLTETTAQKLLEVCANWFEFTNMKLNKQN